MCGEFWHGTGPVGPVQTRLPGRFVEYGDLMAQDEQLHVLGRRRTGEQQQPAEKLDEDQLEQAQRHSARSPPSGGEPRLQQVTAAANFWNPTGLYEHPELIGTLHGWQAICARRRLPQASPPLSRPSTAG
jgi:hypothetical protein